MSVDNIVAIIAAIIGAFGLVIAALMSKTPKDSEQPGKVKKKKDIKIKIPRIFILRINIVISIFFLISGIAWVVYTRVSDRKETLHPISLERLNPWGSFNFNVQGNTVTLSGTVMSAGFNVRFLDASLKANTVVLLIENTEASEFSDGRLIKITANENGEVITPKGISLIHDEYVNIRYEEIEFTLPSNFDGIIGFTFTRAELNNLRITAYYRE